MNAIQDTVTGRKSDSSRVVRPAVIDPTELIDDKEAAALLRQKPQTLAAWRCDGKGPAYLKIGRRVFYTHGAITTFLAGSIVTPGA